MFDNSSKQGNQGKQDFENYWAPLQTEVDSNSSIEVEYPKGPQTSEEVQQHDSKPSPGKSLRKWKRRLQARKERSKTQTAVLDSAATSSFWREQDSHIKTGQTSDKIVILPNGNVTKATEKAILLNEKLNDRARELDVLPDLKHNSLLSVCKLADAGYTTVFRPEDGGVSVHWADDIRIDIKKEAILQGWRDESGLWRVPIKDDVKNPNTDTLLIDRPLLKQAVNNVYELASTEKQIRYLHAALGFPTKATLLKAIRKKFLTSWPGLTTKAVNEFFPDSTETQKGHMKRQHQ